MKRLLIIIGAFASAVSNIEIEKDFKICSVEGAIDITRLISTNTRNFFKGAIDDVELIREVVSESTINGGIRGGMSDLSAMNNTLDWKARNLPDGATTVDAGIGYTDDRVDRRMERFVSLSANKPFIGNKANDMGIVDTVSNLFPWIVDRKSKRKKWWVSHQNGKSQDYLKEPFLFDSFYTAAWIGSYGDAWAYYPPMHVYGHPLTFGDFLGSHYDSHQEAFVEPNLPQNNPKRRAFFTAPYPDSAVPGLSIITAMAPVYYTGNFNGALYDDTYIASTGVDIAVSSVSSLLDVLEKLTVKSFGMLVDSNFNTIVISQSVVEKIYPERTGFEKERVTIDKANGSIISDRRNSTYLVSDTIIQPLSNLSNANWSSILASVTDLSPGQRDYSKLDILLTGEKSATPFHVVYERWKYVADWVLLVLVPVTELENTIKVNFKNSITEDSSEIYLEGVRGRSLSTEVNIVNDGTLDIIVVPKTKPHWMEINPHVEDKYVLKSGNSLSLELIINTKDISSGTSSDVVSFHIQDYDYPDCFYNDNLNIPISLKVSPKDCAKEHPNTVSDLDGNCVCDSKYVPMGEKCVSVGSLLSLIFIPSVIAILVVVYVYIDRKHKKEDSIWVVKPSELLFDDPPAILGRGTFGLVFLAKYRGSQVAVKRVIPKRTNFKGYFKDQGDGCTKSITDLRRSSTVGRKQSISEHLEKAENTSIESVLELGTRSSTLSKVSSGGSGGFNGLRSGALQEQLKNSSENSNGSTTPVGFIKRLFNGKGNEEYSNLKSDFIQEMRQLSKLRHPCVVTVMGAVISKNEDPMLVMECMDHGSLYDVLHNDTMIVDGDFVLPILRDIAQGLVFLHSANPSVIHGDLKAQNVLVDLKFRAKVADFGLSQKKKMGATGTPLWMAPELLRGESGNNTKTDVYSFGMILYEVYSRKNPYEGEEHLQVLKDIANRKINKRPTIPKSMPAAMVSLMTDCLHPDADARPTMDEIVSRLKRLDSDLVEPGTRYVSKQIQKIQEATRNKNLLMEIFPKHVAEALRDGKKVEPEHHDCVTIYFSDIVGFTTISNNLDSYKVSNMLDRLYLQFDELSKKHDVFKIDTIGDAWMGVTNLASDQSGDHASRIARFAIDAMKVSGETLIDEDNKDMGYVKIRIGMHSGPVLSNVLGSRTPKFSIFGDTVNTSSRMESTSLPGYIQSSEPAAKLLSIQDPNLPIVCRGTINVKGKGEMITYWVNQEMNPQDQSVGNGRARCA